VWLAAPNAFLGERRVCTKIARIFTVNGSCGSRTRGRAVKNKKKRFYSKGSKQNKTVFFSAFPRREPLLTRVRAVLVRYHGGFLQKRDTAGPARYSPWTAMRSYT
jgi:hypothetical protein